MAAVLKKNMTSYLRRDGAVWMKFRSQMQNHIEKQQILMLTNLAGYNAL